MPIRAPGTRDVVRRRRAEDGDADDAAADAAAIAAVGGIGGARGATRGESGTSAVSEGATMRAFLATGRPKYHGSRSAEPRATVRRWRAAVVRACRRRTRSRAGRHGALVCSAVFANRAETVVGDIGVNTQRAPWPAQVGDVHIAKLWSSSIATARTVSGAPIATS